MTGKVDYQKVHVLGENEVVNSPRQLLMIDSADDEEISLVDLYLMLSKHRKIMAITLVAVLLLGIFYAFSKPRVFDYSISLQTGKAYISEGDGNHLRPIESADKLLSKIRETYIPLVVNEFIAQNPDRDVPEIQAKIPKNSDIILLDAKGAEDDPLPAALLQRVVDRVVESHRPYMELMKSQFATELGRAKLKLQELESAASLEVNIKRLEKQLLASKIEKSELLDPQLVRVKRQQYRTKIQAHKNRLASLEDKSNQLATQLKRLDQLDTLLEQQIASLSVDIEQALKNRLVSADGVADPSMAMTAMLLNNQLQADRKQMNSLQERLNIKQKNLREQLANDIRENERAIEYEKKLIQDTQNSLAKLSIDDRNGLSKLSSQIAETQAAIDKTRLDHQLALENQQQRVKNLTLKLQSLENTRALSEPLKSVKPVGAGPMLIIVVSLFAGLILAVLLALMREFMLRVQEKTDKSMA